MKTKHRTFEPISDTTYKKLSYLFRHDYESNILATELGKIICQHTEDKQRRTDKAEYARSIVIQILKNETVEETILAECGRSIEEMLSEAEESFKKIMEEKRRKQTYEETAC